MFGCSDHWIGKRFGPALTGILADERRRRELRAHDAVDADALEARHDARSAAASALRAPGAGAADAHGHAHARATDAFVDTDVPDGGTGSPSTGSATDAWTSTATPFPLGRVHVVPSNDETVVLGLLDPTRAPLLTVESGDVLVYADTWTHFLNHLQPGVTSEELAAMRAETRGRGVHSIIGPIAVAGAMPGDVVQLRMLRLETIAFGANFHNPGHLRTGSLPDEFAGGYVRYFELDPAQRYVAFNDRIRLEMKPFQGTIGLAAEEPHAISSVAPGRHAGNIDLKELTAGSSLFVPVAQPGALIFTGDSHALQGDGEVNITALETAMREVRLQVILHKHVPWRWPFAETATHWIALGLDPNLNEALRIALRNTIDFLETRAGLSRDEAYSLASLGIDFRVTQMVDVNHGVHAMIPKDMFAPDYRATIAIA
jgi:acetamidase/formamidase